MAQPSAAAADDAPPAGAVDASGGSAAAAVWTRRRWRSSPEVSRNLETTIRDGAFERVLHFCTVVLKGDGQISTRWLGPIFGSSQPLQRRTRSDIGLEERETEDI